MKGLPPAGPRLLPPGSLLLRQDTAGPARRYGTCCRNGSIERDIFYLAQNVRSEKGAERFGRGWRMQSEVLTLERRQVDLDAGTLRLEPGTTKNDDGRLVYLPPDLKARLAAQVERVRVLERQTGRIIPYLFPHLKGRREGRRVRNFRKTWKTACRKAGVPGMLRHDFRRTAVRNMVNAGVPERVAMTVTGHKTRAVFDRYHIVSPGDLQEVARKLAGTFSGTSKGSELDARPVSV